MKQQQLSIVFPLDYQVVSNRRRTVSNSGDNCVFIRKFDIGKHLQKGTNNRIEVIRFTNICSSTICKYKLFITRNIVNRIAFPRVNKHKTNGKLILVQI